MREREEEVGSCRSKGEQVTVVREGERRGRKGEMRCHTSTKAE